MSSTVLAESPVPLEHHPIGASTGYMLDLRGDWPAQVQRAAEVSRFAVELSALSEDELCGLSRYMEALPALPFRYLSIHGPSKARKMSERDLVEVLMGLSKCAAAVVMHPDTIEDPAPYRALGRKLVLENMDARKQDGRTAAELRRWFDELPEAGFCFDIAHAWSMDSSMAVAAELLDAYRARLRHLHMSSLSEELHHVTLTASDRELFEPLLRRCTDVPWIFEAPPT